MSSTVTMSICLIRSAGISPERSRILENETVRKATCFSSKISKQLDTRFLQFHVTYELANRTSNAIFKRKRHRRLVARTLERTSININGRPNKLFNYCRL